MWTFDPNRHLKGSANPQGQRKRHINTTDNYIIIIIIIVILLLLLLLYFLLSSLFRSLTEVRHRLHVSNCCRTMSSGEDPQDEAYWCSNIEGDARGGSLEHHHQFHTLLLLCPSQLYVILPQLYSISCSWEETVCVEYGRLGEEEPLSLQLWRSCHPCWVRLLTGAVDLGSLTLVAVTLYQGQINLLVCQDGL